MKVKFLTTLDVRQIDDKQVVLIHPFVVDIDGQLVRIPSGFVTDYASVPRVPVAYLVAGDKGSKAAVLHDYLYSLGGTQEDKKYADDAFYAGLRELGIGVVTSWLMYQAVRSFGKGDFLDK